MTSLLEHALAYAARGWAVLPLHHPTPTGCSCGRADCKTPGKHPFARLVKNGVLDATTDTARIAEWWRRHPDCNIGIATGSPSSLLVVDLDDRPMDGRDGSQSWRRLLTVHDDQPDTVEVITGGGGRHVYFTVDHAIQQSKDAIGLGIEVKGDGGYVVAPPSLHHSTRTYEWDAAGHPDDQDVAPAPAWLLSLVRTRAPRIADVERPTGQLDALELAELQSALSSIPADDRDVWIEVGMALHATNDDDRAFPLWDQWSATSEKYDADDARRVWQSFHHRPEGRTLATLYHRAMRHGWARPSVETLLRTAGFAVPDISGILTRPAALVAPTDPLVHSLPGMIEAVAQWSYHGAARPSHVYSVVAALALSSVLCGRRYTTEANNYTALYFMAVGKSGTGKEHIRTTVETILRSIDAMPLIGPNSVKSDAGLFSAIFDAPQSIAIVDEFGQFLESASGKGEAAAMKDTMLTTMMEIWGRAAGTLQTTQYATLSLSEKQKQSVKRRFIDRPSLTFAGLSTPHEFYGALKSRRVTSGFLNRFITLEHDLPRQPFSMKALGDPPSDVLAWAAQLLAMRSDLDSLSRPTNIPSAKVLTFPDQSRRIFAAFDEDCMAEADRLESDQLGELPMRAAEQAMRLALVASLADNPDAGLVGPEFATWGVDVARWALFQLIPSVQQRMADTPIHDLRNRFLAFVREAGERGVSEYELKRARLFAGISRADRKETVDWALEARHVTWTTRMHAGAGRPTRVIQFSQNFTNHEAA